MRFLNPLPSAVMVRAAAACAWVVASAGAMAAAQWELVKLGGHDYVTANSIKNFYHFEKLTRTGDAVVLENKAVEMKLRIGQQECFMNNVKFVFSLKVEEDNGRALVSRIDLAKLIDPVLRPFRGVFIRAPIIESVRGESRVLATLADGRIVSAQEGCWLATSFHPELTPDSRFHRYFLAMTAAASRATGNKGRAA